MLSVDLQLNKDEADRSVVVEPKNDELSLEGKN
jgi:hypothetical protein